MHSNKYIVNVRTGNWLEEMCLQSEKIELYLARRNRDLLLGDQTQEMKAGLLRPVDLDASDEFLKYGENIQLMCPGIRFPGSHASGAGAVLSYSASVRNSSKHDGLLGPGFAVSASPFVEPCVRNCFKICGVESAGCEDGVPLKFGDTFTISPCVSSKPLFVAADVPRLNAKRGLSGHPVLKFVDTPNAYCRWTVTYWNAAFRLEAEGLPVPKGVSVLLMHKTSNQSVTVETDFPLVTFLGNEYEVSARSSKYSGSRNNGHNAWQFTTGHPRSDEGSRTHEQ